jgi:hypothetical protein
MFDVNKSSSGAAFYKNQGQPLSTESGKQQKQTVGGIDVSLNLTQEEEDDCFVLRSGDMNTGSLSELIRKNLIMEGVSDRKKKEALAPICARLSEINQYFSEITKDTYVIPIISTAIKLGTDDNIKNILDANIIKEHHLPLKEKLLATLKKSEKRSGQG